MKKNKTRSINVLHIASGDLWAGAEVQLFTLCTALSKQNNVNVSLVLLNHGKLENKLINSGINVTVFDESERNGLQILKKLIYHIGTNQPDVIHTHRNKENILGSIAALFSGNIPTLRTAHGAPEHYPAWFHLPKRLILFLDKFCGRFLQKKIIAVSQDLADTLQKTFPERKVAVIENGIDIKLLTDSKQAITNNASSIKIGIAGRLVPIKRVDLFIDAAKALKQQHPELTLSFHIYGDGPLQGSLKQQNQQAGTDDIVYFEGHCEHIQDELQTLDMLLMTSDHEGLPMILLEAMVLQVPIIAHAVGGIPNLLDHGRCGILIDQHDAQSYANAIYKLITQKELKAKLTRRALERVNQHFSAKQNADNYILQYRQLIG